MPTRERLDGLVRTPVGHTIDASKRGNVRERVPGVKFASITDPAASLLDGVTSKRAAFSKPQPNDAFLTLVGHCVDGYLIKIHGSKISSQ
jgi:hypothetical protein